MDDAIVEVEGLVKGFKGEVRALDGVDLVVERGDSVAIMGPSGSGKSTLLGLLGGLDRPTSGTLRFDGRDVTGLSEDELAAVRNRVVGFVFQSFQLLARTPAVANVGLPLVYRGLGRAERRRLATEALTSVGLGHRLQHRPSQLSGGEQQRVAIARALAMDPKLLLFDEPTSALDPEMINEVLDVMRDLAAAGMTMIVISHEMGFARSAANRVVFMDGGRILEAAPPEEFFASPRTERAKDFLSKIISH